MLNQLADAIRPSIPRLESQLAQAEANLSSKQAILDSLLVSGELDSPVVSKADAEVAVAERKLKNIQRLLADARSKQSAEQATEQAAKERAEKRASWAAVVAAAEKRHAHISQKLAKSAEEFAQDYVQALKLTAELYASLPAPMPDPEVALLHKDLIEISVRKELQRQGVDYERGWPWGVEGIYGIPDFLPQYDNALDVIRRWAAAQTKD
jgi:hypothetical protein